MPQVFVKVIFVLGFCLITAMSSVFFVVCRESCSNSRPPTSRQLKSEIIVKFPKAQNRINKKIIPHIQHKPQMYGIIIL